MSTSRFPKQFHSLFGTGESLMQQTFNSVDGLIPSENILFTTNKKYCSSYIVTTLKIHNQNPNAVILVAPSDHWIAD